ncbi:hypothetical protein [Ralstonia sp. 1B3]|uniref:hypothetical protein n=1 Tax=Ralstonia sp. 1B3 TaxID=2997421 RepID=UPI002FCC5ECC
MRGNIIDSDGSGVALHGLTMVWREWFWNTERRHHAPVNVFDFTANPHAARPKN